MTVTLLCIVTYRRVLEAMPLQRFASATEYTEAYGSVRIIE
jgi:hypothetical protein